MTYSRVIPRDLFNESKLLKCYGRLSLLIHEGRIAGLPLTLEHDAEPFPGFQVEMDGLRGHFYCSNLKLLLNGSPLRVGTVINSREEYPMVCVTEDESEVEVFNAYGFLTPEFKRYVRTRAGSGDDSEAV
jgi:hypothetical protein